MRPQILIPLAIGLLFLNVGLVQNITWCWIVGHVVLASVAVRLFLMDGRGQNEAPAPVSDLRVSAAKLLFFVMLIVLLVALYAIAGFAFTDQFYYVKIYVSLALGSIFGLRWFWRTWHAR